MKLHYDETHANFKGKLNGQNSLEIEKVKILEFIKNHADNSGF